MIYKLPKADGFGNFWLGKKTTGFDGPAGPAIFPSKRIQGEMGVINSGEFIVFVGSDEGFIFDGPLLRKFSSPKTALDEINKRVKVKGE